MIPPVILTFDPLTPELIVLCSCPMDHLCQSTSTKSLHSVSNYHVHNVVRHDRTNGLLGTLCFRQVTQVYIGGGMKHAYTSDCLVARTCALISHAHQFFF